MVTLMAAIACLLSACSPQGNPSAGPSTAADPAPAAAPSDGALQGLEVKAVGKDESFRLADARGKYVALHFLLKTECPICRGYTHEYATRSAEVPDTVHVFLKPDAEEETQKWFSKYPADAPVTPTIYRDPDGALAERLGIPGGYKFHGEVVHYPALVLVDPDGKEVFRHVGESTFDRLKFDQFKSKMAELKQSK